MTVPTSFFIGLAFILGLCFIHASASNITYPTLPQGNYNTSSSSPGQSGLTSSLSYLFQMSNGFTNIVFLNDFNAISDWLYALGDTLINDIDNAVQYLTDNYNELLMLEIGFLICLAVGVLFILFVIVGGLIMCCCRTCCGGCGGKMAQSTKRRKSGWRYCHCFSLLICTVLMIVPSIFIFITNSWITEILDILPSDLTIDVDNIGEYISTIPKQLNTTIDGYDSLDASIRSDFTNINTTLGVPLQTDITTLVQPAIDQLNVLDGISTSTVGNLTALNTTANSFVAGLDELQAQLTTSKDALLAFLNSDADCSSSGNQACENLKTATSALTISVDTSSLTSVTNEINSVVASIQSADTAGIIQTVNSQLDNIPVYVQNASASVTNEVLTGLDAAKSTLTSATSAIPQDTLDSLYATLNDLKNSINTYLGSEYIGPYQIYRDIAFYVLGGIILLVCTLYLFGLLFGSVSYSSYTQPKYRSCPSDCGGVLIMMGVGFSFIFGWILMILVIVTFGAGSPAERYGCQPLQAPFDGLKFADRLVNISIPITDPSTGTDQTLTISIYDVINNCQQNQAIYTALNLESVLNATALVQNVTNSLDSYKTNLEGITIDLSSIEIYTPAIESALDDLKTPTLTNALSTASSDLGTFATLINTTATDIEDNGPSTLSGYPNQLRAYSYNFTLIETTYLQPLNGLVTDLNTYLADLATISNSLNATVDTTKSVLQTTDTDVQTNGPTIVTNQVTAFADNIFGDVDGYTNWFLLQLNNNIGACLPLYNAYADVVNLFCSYAIDTISGLWFSLGWIVFFLIPAAVFGMKIAKFYRRFSNKTFESEGDDGISLYSYTITTPTGDSSVFRRSARIHPSEYY